MKRIPSLDGLRAVSILMVIALHTLQRLNLAHHVNKVWFLLGNGATGVYIFFVISGYLITTLLLNEQKKYGIISLKHFYLRRIFRIFPPLYFYVAVLAALAMMGRLPLSRMDIISALLFFRNYATHLHAWALEHTWTLSIEEQFYLLWPMILLLCLRYKPGMAGRVVAARIAIVVIAVSPVIRVLTYFVGNPYFRHGIGGMFQTRADSLMFGCVIALLSGTQTFEKIYGTAARVWWVFPVVLFLVSGILELRYQNYWDFPIGFTVNGICIAFFLLWCVRNPETIVGRFLNSRPMMHIGVLSYSIYIWQTFFLHEKSITVFGGSTVFNRWPTNIFFILVAAEFSYHIIEQPLLRLRDRAEQKLGWIRTAAANSIPVMSGENFLETAEIAADH